MTVDDFNDSATAQEKFAAAVFKPQWARKTVATHLVRFCSFGNWLYFAGHTDARHRPARRLTRKPQIRDLPTDEEVAALLSILKQRYRQAYRTPNRQRAYHKDYLVTALLIETGARIGEVMHIERRDLIEHKRKGETHYALLLRGTKSEAAERAVMISRALFEELREYGHRWKLTGRLFISRTGKALPERTYGQWLSDFCERMEVSCHVSPHTFRYRRVLKWICEGKSIGEVMSRIGHTDPEMTIYYFNQVRRLMPWVEVNGDLAIIESRQRFWQGRRKEK